MKVSIKKSNDIERELTITVDAERVQAMHQKVTNRYQRSAKIDGFRQGKAPMAMIQQRFADRIASDSAQALISDAFQEAIKQENLAVVNSPSITIDSSLELGNPLVFRAVCEIYPTVKLSPVDKLRIDARAAEIADEDVTQAVERLRHQHSDWRTVDRPAAADDRVIMSFAGMLDDTPIERGSAERTPYLLGSHQLLPEFETELAGMSADEEKDIEVNFPQNYAAEKLAGRTAQFHIIVHEVKERVLPVIDQDFLDTIGFTQGGVDSLKEEMRQDMSDHCRQLLIDYHKKVVFDALLAANSDFSLPKSMVDHEIDVIYQQQVDAHQKRNMAIDHIKKDDFRAEAERRIRLLLVLRELVQAHDIKLDPDRVEAKLGELSREYVGESAKIREQMRNDKQLMQRVESLCLEEQVVDHILGTAKVDYKNVSFTELQAQGR